MIVTPIIFFKPVNFLSNIFKYPSLSSVIDENINLRKKVASLEAELYSVRESYNLPSKMGYIRAKVYSIYPFNAKNRIFLSVGLKNGVSFGSAVLFSDNVFVGKIIKVSNTKSEVMTIFDPNFLASVRIGKNEINGLLHGGVNPTIKLIDKTQKLRTGDKVVLSDNDFPYGLLIGEVGIVSTDGSGAFLEATVKISYSVNELKTVTILPIQ